MKNNVMIKPFFGEWKEVDEESAIRFAHLIYNHIKNQKQEDKIRMVKGHVKGINLEEVLGNERK